MLSFLPAELIAGIEKTLKADKFMIYGVKHLFPKITRKRVLCVHVISILKAIDIRYIFFFSLDVEAAEKDMLKTIPFIQVTINLFKIEYLVPHSDAASEKSVNEYYNFFQ